jgi:DNA-directed RNA polymerase
VTPSGFVVIYASYFRRDVKHRSTIRNLPGSKDGRINHVYKEAVISQETGNKLPDLKAFAAGISPNFVHSMDAAHMHLVAAKHDGPFAGIHDSYATTSDKVNSLKSLTRETFVKIYDRPNYLADIRTMLTSDPISMKKFEPELGTLNIKDVLSSTYFFA